MYVFGGQDGGYQRGLRSGVDHHTNDAGMRARTGALLADEPSPFVDIEFH
jgi:hypothetical protein